MKGIRHICLLLLLICMSFLVVNYTYTKEIIRIYELDKTPYSFEFYLTDVAVEPNEMLSFFETIAEEHQVSIIKTDSGDTVIKAGVFSTETFPYSQFGIDSLDFGETGQRMYSNTPHPDQVGRIPTFLQAKPIQLMQLAHYLTNNSPSLNGLYRVSSTQAIDRAALVEKLTHFFQRDADSLLDTRFSMAVEPLNRDVLISLGIAAIALLLLILTTLYQPILEMKEIGVEKLLGYSQWMSLWRLIKPQLILLLSSSLIIQAAPYFFLDYIPAGFSLRMFLAHGLLFLMYLLLNSLVLLIIRSIDVASMLKGFSSFTLGFYLNSLLKLLLTLLMTALMIGVGNSIHEEQIRQDYQEQWQKEGDYLTLEYVTASEQLWQDSLSGSEKAHLYYQTIYQQLADTLPTYYIRSSQLALGNLIRPGEASEISADQTVDVLYANASYLDSLGFPLPDESRNSIFLFPKGQLPDQQTNQVIAQLINRNALPYEEQEKQALSQMPITIIYYEGDWTFFPYDEARTTHLVNPIIRLVKDIELSWEDRAYLSSTGLSSPIKIPNTPANRAKIEQLVQALPDSSYLKFSSIASIQQGWIDTYRDASRNFIVLFGILLLLSGLLSYFIIVSLFIWRTAYIATMKFLGWTFIDRYKPFLIGLGLLYVLPLPVLAISSTSPLPVLLFAGSALFDSLLFLGLVFRMEQTNLSRHLKGERL